MTQSLTRNPPLDDYQATELTHPLFNKSAEIHAFEYDRDGFNAISSALKYLEEIPHWDEFILGPAIPKLTFITAYGVLSDLRPRYLMPGSVSPHDGGIMLKWNLPNKTILLGIEAGTVRLTGLNAGQKLFSFPEQAFIDFIPDEIKKNLPLFVTHA